MDGEVPRGDRCVHALAQRVAAAVEGDRPLGSQDLAQACDARGHGQDVVVEGPGMGESVGARGIEAFHDPGGTAEGAEAEPAAEILPEGDQVGDDAERSMQAGRRQARRHDLVEDQQAAGGARLLAQHGEELGRRRNAAAPAQHRLQDHAGEIGGVRADRGPGGGDVVVGHDHERKRRVERRPVAREDEHAPVIAALHRHHLGAPGEDPGDADGHQIRLGARIREAHQFQGREALDDQLGEARLVAVRRAQHDAVVERGLDRLDDRGFGMPVEPGRVLGHEIRVAVPVHVPDMAALAARDRDGEGRVVDDAAGVAPRHDAPRVVMTARAQRMGVDEAPLRLREGRSQIEVARRVHGDLLRCTAAAGDAVRLAPRAGAGQRRPTSCRPTFCPWPPRGRGLRREVR